MAASPPAPHSDSHAPIVDTPGGCVIAVRVVPRAKKSAFDGARGGALLVRLQAPPVDGAANAALIELFADVFQVARRAVTLMSGEKARDKRLRIEGVSAAQAADHLRARGYGMTSA